MFMININIVNHNQLLWAYKNNKIMILIASIITSSDVMIIDKFMYTYIVKQIWNVSFHIVMYLQSVSVSLNNITLVSVMIFNHNNKNDNNIFSCQTTGGNRLIHI